MDNKKENNNKNMKCDLKCKYCTHYNQVNDYCREKEINHCSKQIHTDFSTCDSFLVRENLIMF